jgi:hypothetical protein
MPFPVLAGDQHGEQDVENEEPQKTQQRRQEQNATTRWHSEIMRNLRFRCIGEMVSIFNSISPQENGHRLVSGFDPPIRPMEWLKATCAGYTHIFSMGNICEVFP